MGHLSSSWIGARTQVLRSNISYLILVNLVAGIKLFWNSKVLCNNCLKRSIQLGFLCIKKMVLTCHSISRQSLWSSYSQVNPCLYYERVVEIILSHSVITYSLLFLHICPRFVFSPHSNLRVILEFSPPDRQARGSWGVASSPWPAVRPVCFGEKTFRA